MGGRQVAQYGVEQAAVEKALVPAIDLALDGHDVVEGLAVRAGRAAGVDQDVPEHPAQPGPQRSAVVHQPGQVPPGAQEGLLDGVLGGRAVVGEPLRVPQQGGGVVAVELAQRGSGVGGGVRVGKNRRHVY